MTAEALQTILELASFWAGGASLYYLMLGTVRLLELNDARLKKKVEREELERQRSQAVSRIGKKLFADIRARLPKSKRIRIHGELVNPDVYRVWIDSTFPLHWTLIDIEVRVRGDDDITIMATDKVSISSGPDRTLNTASDESGIIQVTAFVLDVMRRRRRKLSLEFA